PRASLCPLTADGYRRDTDHFSGLVEVEATEEPQLDDLGFSWVALRQFLQRFVYCDQIARAVDDRAFGFLDSNNPDTAAVGTSCPAARHVHQDVAHQTSCHSDKVRPVLPAGFPPIDQSNERFVHECGGLEHMARPLAPEIPMREHAELRFDQRYE